MKIFRHFITIFFLIANVEIKIFNIEKRASANETAKKEKPKKVMRLK